MSTKVSIVAGIRGSETLDETLLCLQSGFEEASGMIPSAPHNGVTPAGACQAECDWSPPELLLDAAADDDGLIVKLIEAFGEDTAARIERIHAALSSCDFPAIRSEAHTIKGSASQMGADAVAEVCRELEQVVVLRDASLVTPLLNRVLERFAEIQEAMAAYAKASESSVTP